MRPLKFTLVIETRNEDRLHALLIKASELSKCNYSVERFTGESGETTTVTFESHGAYILKQVADLVYSIFDEDDGWEEEVIK